MTREINWTYRIVLISEIGRGFKEVTSVRTADNENFQVCVNTNIGKPYGDTPAEFIEEINRVCGALVDVKIDFEEAAGHAGSEIAVRGWRDARENDMPAIREAFAQ